MSVSQMFIAAIVLFLITTILTAINWALQSKISSRISALEKELEKKNSELDALKKERASTAPKHGAPAPSTGVSVQMEVPAVQQQALDDDTIQIMRNVGGIFQTATAGLPHASSPQSMSAAPPPVIKPAYQRSPADTTGVVIPLFSLAAQGADLNRLYQLLMEALKTRNDRLIVIDCAGVLQLSGQELDYIETLCRSLEGRKRSLVFQNCAPQLLALVQNRPPIAALVR
jgi:hypothetical protein